MSKPIIEIEGIGKRYRLGATKEPYLSLRDELTKWFSSAARRARAAEEEFWALRDVSFSVEPGEAVGIIGRNGAGKSTLLKILSQITPPTEGKITMRGRVGSLLEVGTGFHPELTGRENIYMNGAILGMTRREIARKFDEIVAFAEMEKFLDTPVKRYSSGMYVRLAFAVAAHLEPEILIIDEVLAVGDVGFQKKCLDKMGEVAHGGRTILFVSHNLGAVQTLCGKCVLFENGAIRQYGVTDSVVEAYISGANVMLAKVESRKGNKKVVFEDFSLADGSGNPRSSIQMGDTLCVNFRLRFLRDVGRPVISFGIWNATNDLMTHVVNLDEEYILSNVKAGEVRSVQVAIPNVYFTPSDYFISLWVGEDTSTTCDYLPNCLCFQVLQNDVVKRGGPFPAHARIFMPTHWESLA